MYMSLKCAVKPSGLTSVEVSQGFRLTWPSRLETVKQLVCMVRFSKKCLQRWSLRISGSPQHVSTRESDLYSFIGVLEGIPFHARCLADSRNFLYLYLQRELKLSVPAIKGYRSSHNHVFTLAGMALTANSFMSRMLSGFENSFLFREIKRMEALWFLRASHSCAI